MSRFVVDASVAIKWYLPEVHDQAALRLLRQTGKLVAPDLIYSEVGSILWKRVRAGQISRSEAETVLNSFGRMPITISPSWPLVLSAFTVACESDRTVYDSLYIALAVRENAVMVTADEKFFNAVQRTPLASFVLWVEDIPED